MSLRTAVLPHARQSTVASILFYVSLHAVQFAPCCSLCIGYQQQFVVHSCTQLLQIMATVCYSYSICIQVIYTGAVITLLCSSTFASHCTVATVLQYTLLSRHKVVLQYKLLSRHKVVLQYKLLSRHKVVLQYKLL